MNKFKRFYLNSIQPRYKNEFGMELYNFEFDFHSKKLTFPYADFSKGIFRKEIYGFDQEKVFIFKANGIKYYNPTAISQYALICYEKILNKKNLNFHKNQFKIQVDWICKNVTIEDDKAIWYYNYPNSDKFFSGIAQGFVISVLLRAYQEYKQTKYLDLAIKSFNFLNTPVKEGGVLSKSGSYSNWYEEYIVSKKVLNGHIYSLFGIYDLYRVTNLEEAKISFQKGINDIKINFKKYDLKFFTKYLPDTRQPANNSYNYTHYTQFLVLYKITNDNFFKKKAKKVKLYHTKLYYKVINIIYIFIISLSNVKN